METTADSENEKEQAVVLRPDDPIIVKRRDVERIANALCSCGGRGPDDDPCDACATYHELLRLGDAKSRPPVPAAARCGDCVFWHLPTTGPIVTASPVCACADSPEYLMRTAEAHRCASFHQRSQAEGGSDESIVGQKKDA